MKRPSTTARASVADRPLALPPVATKRIMPIGQYLNGERFDRETTRVMGLAFEIARLTLGVGDRGVDAMIAKRIIELAKAGERNADRLCEYALAKVREADGNTSQLYQSSSASRAAATEAGFINLSQSGERPER
jgi:hypothetical protein